LEFRPNGTVATVLGFGLVVHSDFFFPTRPMFP